MKMQKYVCSVCGYIYDPAEGDADGGIAAELPLLICRMIGNVLIAV